MRAVFSILAVMAVSVFGTQLPDFDLSVAGGYDAYQACNRTEESDIEQCIGKWWAPIEVWEDCNEIDRELFHLIHNDWVTILVDELPNYCEGLDSRCEGRGEVYTLDFCVEEIWVDPFALPGE